MILKKEYYSQNSLLSDVEELCKRETPVTIKLLATIVSKYTACLIWESVSRPISYAIFRELLSSVEKQLVGDSKFGVDETIEALRVQLTMIFDNPATIAVMQDIITRLENLRLDDSEWVIWLDLWSWSWIGILAQSIWLRRAWIKNPKITGIELDAIPQEFSNMLVRKLWIWEVRNGDIRDIREYPETEPRVITIELLPTRWVPFLHHRTSDLWWGIWYEPFLEALVAIKKRYWADVFKRISMFPAWLEIGNIFSNDRTIWLSENIYELWRLWEEKIWNATTASYFPTRILIGNNWQELDSVWENIGTNLFEWERRMRRWEDLTSQELYLIQEHQRTQVRKGRVVNIWY